MIETRLLLWKLHCSISSVLSRISRYICSYDSGPKENHTVSKALFVRQTDVTNLLETESETGKHLVFHFCHENGIGGFIDVLASEFLNVVRRPHMEHI
jgi:hypothetical protein